MGKIKEKMNLKVMIGIILIVLLIILFLVIKNHNNKVAINDNGVYVYSSLELVKDVEYKGLKFTNISMTSEKGYTTFTCDVTNTTDKDIEKETYNIKLKDKNNKEVVTLLAYLPGGIKKGETKTVTASTQGEYKEITSKEITE